MANNDKIEMEGTVTKVLKGTKFEVVLDDNNLEVICTMSGRVRINKIRIFQGDRVTVAISPYDLNKGIITWRHR